jgi:hypothetical protein
MAKALWYIQFNSLKIRGVSHYGLAIYMKKYFKGKKEL